MKRVLPLILALCLMLCACAKEPAETEPTTVATTAATTAPTTEPTTAPTTEPTTAPTTEPPVLYTNPLTGEEIDEPYHGRIYTVTINNVPPALPHYGVNDADIFWEMLINDGATRGLAMFADPSGVTSVGSIRSARYNFVDICEAYDAILAHAGGSSHVMSKVYNCGIDNMDAIEPYFFRDYDRYYGGFDWEHCLFITGDGLIECAEDMGYRTTTEEERDYGLVFSQGATPKGETADEIYFHFWSNSRAMMYNADTGRYEFWQYGEPSMDGLSGDVESFKNVLLLQMDVYNSDIYHVADLDGTGDGYYACNGKIVPIRWHHEDEYEPFTFTLTDGTPLQMDVGNSYIGFIPLEDEISWE